MPASPICVPNIGPQGQQRRMIGGTACLVLGVAGAIVFAARGTPLAWYAVLTVPFSFAALGYFQARERT
jgi:hypothetical protein